MTYLILWGTPPLILLFPVLVGVGSYFWTRKNIKDGSGMMKPNWAYVGLFFGVALALTIFIAWVGQ